MYILWNGNFSSPDKAKNVGIAVFCRGFLTDPTFRQSDLKSTFPKMNIYFCTVPMYYNANRHIKIKSVQIIFLQKIQAKNELRKMMMSYFKEIDKSKIIKTAEGEKVNYPYLDSYWTDEKREAFYVVCNNNIVGFCLINDWVVCEDFKAEKSMAEFYIKPEFRKKGIGKQVAFELFDKYQSKWEIRPAANNQAAIQFWRSIIGDYTKGDYVEKVVVKGNDKLFVQLFDSNRRADLCVSP